MAAITSYTEVKQLKFPGMRLFKMSADDADTFTPTEIKAEEAIAFYNEDPGTGNPIGCTVSSGTVTINCSGMSDVDVYLLVFGKD